MMTKKDYELIIDTLNEVNRDVNGGNKYNISERIAQKNLMDTLAHKFAGNLKTFNPNFDSQKFLGEYISNF